METTFKEGDIVVATESQSTSCGICYINKDSILEVADSQIWYDYVTVYRSITAKRNYITHDIRKNKLRFATKDEIDAFKNGARSIDQVEQFKTN